MISMVVIIGGAFYYNFMKRVIASKEILAAIEKGIDVPFPAAERVPDRRRRGYLLTSVGIAFTIALWATSGDFGVAAWGLIPTAFGVANLLISNEAKQAEEEAKNS